MQHRSFWQFLVATTVLCSCSTSVDQTKSLLDRQPFDQAATISQNDVTSVLKNESIKPENHYNTGSSNDPSDDENRLVYYRGQNSQLPGLAKQSNTYQVETLQLNFENAAARDVATIVIAQALGKTVAVAEGVSGQITLSSPTALPVREALDALETVLAASGLALRETQSGYLLTTLQTAQSATQSVGGNGIGYLATIRPIAYSTPTNVVRLAKPFLSNTVSIVADDQEGVVTLQGPRAEIDQAMKVVDMFDSPALAGQVSGLFTVRYADATALKDEIERILAADGKGNAKSVQLIDLPRINQLLVITRTKSRFAEVQKWIERLDVASGGDERRLRYYTARNAPADILAQQLSGAFGGQFSATSDTPSQTGNNRINARPQTGNSQSVSITSDDINNALIIRATDSEYREILSLVQKMDIMPPQVLIEATIAEVTLSDSLSFGVRWFLENGGTDLTMSDNESGAVGAVFPGFSATYFKDLKAGVAINTLSSVTDVTVLSAPSIMVQNNQTANLQVGDEVPIITQQSQSVSDGNAPIISTVQLRETGVILEVKPRINANNMVVLEVSQEVSEVAETVTDGIDTPTIQQRQFTSTVAVPDNGTVALGGLIRESRTNNASGIPGLKDAPLIGNLFKTQSKGARRTELIIFLTPRIIRNQSESEEVLDYLQSKMGSLTNRLDQ